MLILKNDTNHRVRLVPKTAGGFAAKIEGVPEWSGDEIGFHLEVAKDGLSANVVTPDNSRVHTADLRVIANVDLGAGFERTTFAQRVCVCPPDATPKSDDGPTCPALKFERVAKPK